MRAGEVVRIRVNPQDAMSVADIVRKLGFNYTGMSFSQACAIALSSLLETVRENGAIPRRDGFEFAEIMAPFGLKQRTGRKLDITKTFNLLAGSEGRVPAIPVAVRGFERSPEPELTPEQRQAKFRYEELCLKREHAPESMTAEDEAEWTRVLAVLAGD